MSACQRAEPKSGSPTVAGLSSAFDSHQASPTPFPPQLIRRCHPYARNSASHAVLSRMQLALHATRRTPHGASRLVLAMPAWSVKTRRAPPRHCKDARLYCHTATAIHDMSTHHPPRARSGGLIMRKAVIIDMNIVVCFVLLAVCCLLPSFYCSKATGLLSTVFYVRCTGACSCLYLVM